jgi:hypothetical protein
VHADGDYNWLTNVPVQACVDPALYMHMIVAYICLIINPILILFQYFWENSIETGKSPKHWKFSCNDAPVMYPLCSALQSEAEQ